MPKRMWLWLKDACIDVGVGFFVLGFGTAWFVPDLTSTQLSMAVVLLVLGVVLFFASAFIALAIGEGK